MPNDLPPGAHRQSTVSTPSKPLVCLTMPSYDGRVEAATAESFNLLATRGAVDIVRARCCSSLLTKVFNSLWCVALNARSQGVTHFAMLHADIIPAEAGWLDVMIAELQRLDADAVAAVSPLKNEFGLTSTAVAIDHNDPWICRRLTMREVYELPETFGADDVGGPLLLNTGLWVCDLRKPWVDEMAEGVLKLCFDFKNRIVKNPDTGEFHAESISEDWLFSQELNRLGAKLFATRKVKLGHVGGKEYTTDRAWGTQATDLVFHKLVTSQETAHATNHVHAGLPGESGGREVLPQGSDGGGERGECPALPEPGRCRRRVEFA